MCVCVPSVPWTPICPVICPVCPADVLPLELGFPHELAQTSWVSLGRPEFIPGTLPGIPATKFLYVIFLYRHFLPYSPFPLRVFEVSLVELGVWVWDSSHFFVCVAKNSLDSSLRLSEFSEAIVKNNLKKLQNNLGVSKRPGGSKWQFFFSETF